MHSVREWVVGALRCVMGIAAIGWAPLLGLGQETVDEFSKYAIYAKTAPRPGRADAVDTSLPLKTAERRLASSLYRPSRTRTLKGCPRRS